MALYRELFKTDSRTALVRKNILLSFLAKGWSGIVVLLLVPITLRCLGEYSNGVWITISTMLVWIDTMDIGLGNGLRNQLAVCMAHDHRQEARNIVSSTFFMLILIIIPIMTLLLAVVYLIDLYGFLNVSPRLVPDLTKATFSAIILLSGTFVFKFIGNVYMGLQMPAINNILVAGGQTLTLLATYVAFYTGHTSLFHIAVINTLFPLLVWVSSYIPTFFYKYSWLGPHPKYFDWQTVKAVLSESIKFFVLQIAGLVLFMSTSLLISRWFSPAEVTPYNIAYRYFYILMLFSTIVCMPYWNATTDAYERHDVLWIKKSSRKLNFVMVGIAITTLLFIAVSQPVYDVWINQWQHNNIKIPLSITVIMGVYQFILILSMRYSYFLNGVSALRLQLLFTVGAAICFIPLAWMAKELTGKIEFLLLAMCLVNLPGLFINIIQFNKILAGQANGFWRIK